MVAQRLLIRIRKRCAYNLAIVVAFIYTFLYKQESIFYLLIRIMTVCATIVMVEIKI